MSSIHSSDGVLVVQWWAFTLWWIVFLGVHVAACGYNMAYAFFYWWLNDTTIRVYLVFYHLGMPPTYYGIIAAVHLSMSIMHGLCVVLMSGSSLWLRRIAFTPWSVQNNSKEPSGGMGRIKVIEVKTANRHTSRVNSAVIKGVSKLTAQIANRYGFLGVNGPYFHVISLSRELIETSLQTIQAYRMSHLLPSMLLNRFYVVGLVLNCWSPVIVYTLFSGQDEAGKRFASLASDCALDLLSCMGVTLLVVLSYVAQYDPESTDFGVNPWYDDEWAARALNQFQMVLVVSWSDLASRAIFSIGLLMTTTNLKELLCPIPRLGNRVVNFADSTVDMPRPIRLKSVLPKPPSARLLSQINEVKTLKSNKSGRISKIAMHVVHFLFFVWGIIVLALHIQASMQPALQQCTLQVRPWAVSRPYCFLVSLDCHRLDISGHLEEVDLKWREFDGSTVVMMVIKHCPQLNVPDTFNEFHQLISIKVYNTTILEWRESTAITNANHPNFLSLMLVRVNMTDGHLPAGFQSTDMPLNLYDFEFCITNLKELPDDLDLKWFPGSYVIIEYSQLEAVPATLIRLTPPYVSLTGNPIRELPPEIFEIEGLTDLGIGDTKISELPYNVTRLSATLTSIYVEGTQISSFWSWTDEFLGRPSNLGVPRSIYAADTIYCDDLERIKNGSVSIFSTESAPDFSTLLMDPKKAALDGEIWSWVDCNPTMSGVTGPLYPLDAEDKQNAIDFSTLVLNE